MTTLTHEERQALISVLPGNTREQRETYERYVDALARISPILLPQRFVHPLRAQVMAGPSAFPELLSLLARTHDPDLRATVLEAIGLVIEEYHVAPLDVIAVLDRELSSSFGPHRTLAGRALALAGYEKLLGFATKVLQGSQNNAELRIAARLVGFGRYAPAMTPVVALLSPQRLSIIDAMIWALGRIGSEEPLPILHAVLGSRIMVEDVAEALGAIGSWSSMTPLLSAIAGPTAEREAVLHAIAEIAARHGDRMHAEPDAASARSILGTLIDNDASETARYYAIVAHSALGGTMSPNRFFTALGAPIAEKNLDPMSAFFASRGSKKPR